MPLTLPHAMATSLSARRGDLPCLEATWTDPVTDARGYLVIDRLVRGVSSGGLRMRPGCTLGEVRGLARGMTLKEAIHYEPDARYVPLGGAKGGIDFDPEHPLARDVLRRYLDAIRPLAEQQWALGEDLGLRQDLIDDVVRDIGMTSSIQAVYPLLPHADAAKSRLARALATTVDGLWLDELVGGYGVAQATLAACDAVGLPRHRARVLLQGFGSMGGATARFLARAGLRVVGIADAHGVVVNQEGLNVERLLATRTPSGLIDRRRLEPGDTEFARERWLSVPADVIVPAAVSYCIDESNCVRVQSKLVVEAANMPVTCAAEAALAHRGVMVVPDFVANSATNAWWWWTLFGDVDGTTEGSFAKIESRMKYLVDSIIELAGTKRTSLREAALTLASEGLTELTSRYGDHPR